MEGSRYNGGLSRLIFNLHLMVANLPEGENQTLQKIFVDHSAELENELNLKPVAIDSAC